jgi:2-polyprenyl-6-methoxyphenol hydroxylase-like FAD-dependent oxidoreductase
MRGDKTLFLCVFHDEYLPPGERDAKTVVKQIFGGAGWECPQILAAMETAAGVYFDRVSQIRMPRWTGGRAALAGDAAACVSLLAGEGTGLAMAEAYVLAGELHACGGDFSAAFARYEQRMMPFLKRKQESAARFASSFAPKSAHGIKVRNLVTRLLRFPPVAELFVARDLRDDVELPEYGFPP